MAPPISGAAISSARRANFDQALADLDQAIRFAPESAEALHARGLIRQRQGNHQAAISDFGAAIDRNPFAAPPYQARGESYLALGQFQAALDDFNAALNVDNKNAAAWAGRGLAHEKLGHKTEALESYQTGARRWTMATPWRAPASGGCRAARCFEASLRRGLTSPSAALPRHASSSAAHLGLTLSRRAHSNISL